MGTFSATKSGIGADSYWRYQKEAVYGTALIAAPIYLPVTDGVIKKVVADIENQVAMASRLKQTPDAGRVVISGELEINMAPALVGGLFNLLLGASSDAGDANVGYTHTWLTPITGLRLTKSATFEQGQGINIADQFDGVVVTSLTMSSDSEGNQKAKFNLVGQGYTADQARPGSFSYSSVVPFGFGMTTLVVTPEAGLSLDAFTLQVKAYEILIDLGYNLENFYLGSTEITQPVFQTIPVVTAKITVDADAQFLEWARDKNYCKLVFSTVHSSAQAGAASGNYSIFVEIPKAKMSPETEIPFGYERLDMELEFDCSFGGTTTGSGGTSVMAEVRVLDATAAYA